MVPEPLAGGRVVLLEDRSAFLDALGPLLDDVLTAAGCGKMFVEHAARVLARRHVLDDVLDHLREGDTLVVTKLDSLGCSMRNLKQVADDVQVGGTGLKALPQGIATTILGGRLSFRLPAAIAKFEHDHIAAGADGGGGR